LNDDHLRRLQVACSTRQLPDDLAENLEQALNRYFAGACSLETALIGCDLLQRDNFLCLAASLLPDDLSPTGKAKQLAETINNFESRIIQRYQENTNRPLSAMDNYLLKARSFAKLPTSAKQLHRIINLGHTPDDLS